MKELYVSPDYLHASDADFEQWETELEPVDFAPEEIELAGREAPQRSWPESTSVGPTEAQYNDRLAWRAGNAEHALDIVREHISSEGEAAMWTAMKLRAIELQDGNLYDHKSDDINDFADEVMRFVSGFDFNFDAYDKVRNK